MQPSSDEPAPAPDSTNIPPTQPSWVAGWSSGGQPFNAKWLRRAACVSQSAPISTVTTAPSTPGNRTHWSLVAVGVTVAVEVAVEVAVMLGELDSVVDVVEVIVVVAELVAVLVLVTVGVVIWQPRNAPST